MATVSCSSATNLYGRHGCCIPCRDSFLFCSSSALRSFLRFNSGVRFGRMSNRPRRFCVMRNAYSERGAHRTTIYVRNLPPSCGQQELVTIVQRLGIIDQVESVEVARDNETGQNSGMGFVTLSTKEAAEAALSRLDGYTLLGKRIRATLPRPSKRETATDTSSASHTRLFVSSLPFGVDAGSLEEFFQAYGRVVSAKIVYDRETGRSRGFGFVIFSNPAEAEEAMKSLDGAECDGRFIQVKRAIDSQS